MGVNTESSPGHQHTTKSLILFIHISQLQTCICQFLHKFLQLPAKQTGVGRMAS